jgi:hypothetical protein
VWIDFVRVSVIVHVTDYGVRYSHAFGCIGAAVQQVIPRRPGASLANPNKAVHRVTAVEFASDGDDPWRSVYPVRCCIDGHKLSSFSSWSDLYHVGVRRDA